ncbi:hypothetical protein TW95_gp1479 [Pandoravirus inopinatum]|uniref:Uncharacterized protein n=1 Tax=Pandoravirus inopinatum TaxID=1605721 RepID=A0A0B5IZA7_9VIRU|nr:hypothetical protein TW95_gp1479 [Pandoravirus inopinatum]AJF98213.1 hypothetical protein [Pandoravirus inopinatum]
MSTTAGRSRTARTRRGANIGQGSLPPITSADLGIEALPGVSRPDQQGRLLGFGRGGVYNNKLQIPITQEVADALNNAIQNDIADLQTAAATLPPEQAPFLSAGLAGPIGPQGQAGYYLPGLQQFYQDDRAEIFIPASADDAAAIGLVVPGSFRQLEALRAGVPAGQVVVKNPNNQNGYLKVGSDGWFKVISSAGQGESRASREDIENLIGQGALYGLAPVFLENNIDVEPYVDANNNVRFALVAPATIKSVGENRKFRRNVADWYANFGVDPGLQARGRVGAATLGSAHAGRTVGPNGETDPAAINQSIRNRLDETGSVRGAFGWAPEFATPASRRGLTAFALVDPNTGLPLANPSDPSGVCTFSSYGPGTNANANANGKGVMGARLYKNMIRHATGMRRTSADPPAPTSPTRTATSTRPAARALWPTRAPTRPSTGAARCSTSISPSGAPTSLSTPSMPTHSRPTMCNFSKTRRAPRASIRSLRCRPTRAAASVLPALLSGRRTWTRPWPTSLPNSTSQRVTRPPLAMPCSTVSSTRVPTRPVRPRSPLPSRAVRPVWPTRSMRKDRSIAVRCSRM